MKGSHVAAFLIGAIAGGVAALLYAPQSGKKTRKQIREYVGEEMEQAPGRIDATKVQRLLDNL